MSDWPFYRRRLSTNGIEHRRIDFFDRDPAVYWKNAKQLDDCISQIRPDVVHCHSGVPACAAATVRDANPGSFRLISQLRWGMGVRVDERDGYFGIQSFRSHHRECRIESHSRQGGSERAGLCLFHGELHRRLKKFLSRAAEADAWDSLEESSPAKGSWTSFRHLIFCVANARISGWNFSGRPPISHTPAKSRS
jgi:hypothetical protein